MSCGDIFTPIFIKQFHRILQPFPSFINNFFQFGNRHFHRGKKRQISVTSWIGRIGTEFVLGGQSAFNGNDIYDGTIVQAFPEGCYGWHLGDNGSEYMHSHSVGIETCNFGPIKDGKTYTGQKANPLQIVELKKSFRGHKTWHRYSDKQLIVLKDLILYIADRDNIDVREGLVEQIKLKGVDGFEFNSDAYYGKVKGMWTHTNTRKDKSDMFPQQELIDMLLSL